MPHLNRICLPLQEMCYIFSGFKIENIAQIDNPTDKSGLGGFLGSLEKPKWMNKLCKEIFVSILLQANNKTQSAFRYLKNRKSINILNPYKTGKKCIRG